MLVDIDTLASRAQLNKKFSGLLLSAESALGGSESGQLRVFFVSLATHPIAVLGGTLLALLSG